MFCADVVWQSLPLMNDFGPLFTYSHFFNNYSQLLPACHRHDIYADPTFLQPCSRTPGSLPSILCQSIAFFYVFCRSLTFFGLRKLRSGDPCRESTRPSSSPPSGVLFMEY
jgi:hypothetical protein